MNKFLKPVQFESHRDHEKNIYRPLLINTTLIIPFIFSIYGLVIDLPLINESFKSFYIIGRLAVAIFCLFFLFQINILKKQFEYQVPAIYLVIILYCAQGQYLVNGYYLAFMQATAGFSLFFAMPKKYYYPITFFGNSLVLYSIWQSVYVYSEDPARILKFKVDTSFGILLNSLICLIGYLTITLSREQKQILSEKFLHVGRYFGNFVHEIKGMISSPTIYVELLATEVNKTSPQPEYLKEIVANLKTDLDQVHQKIMGINSLSKNSDEIVSLNIRSLTDSLQKHFFHKDNLNIKVVGPTNYIIANEYSVRSILLNLLSNSKENFSEKHVNQKSIVITLAPQKIIFRDNGGGFSENALKKMNKNSFFTEKALGSGMGIFIIKEYMKEFNGSAFFKNRTDGVPGVEIVLTFAKLEL